MSWLLILLINTKNDFQITEFKIHFFINKKWKYSYLCVEENYRDEKRNRPIISTLASTNEHNVSALNFIPRCYCHMYYYYLEIANPMTTWFYYHTNSYNCCPDRSFMWMGKRIKNKRIMTNQPKLVSSSRVNSSTTQLLSCPYFIEFGGSNYEKNKRFKK